MVDSKKLNNTYCSVPQCRSWKRKDPNVSFHRFPGPEKKILVQNPDGSFFEKNQRDEWVRLLRIGKKVSKFMHVCSRHFKRSDYVPTYEGKQVRRPNLKRNVVPSMNLPVTPTEVKVEVDDDSAQTLKENLPKIMNLPATPTEVKVEMDDDIAQTLIENLLKTPGEKCVIRDCPNYSEEHDANAFAESGVKTPLRSLMCSKHFSEENSETDQESESNLPEKDEASPSRNVPEHHSYPLTGSDNYQSRNMLKRKSKTHQICKAKLLRRKGEIKRLKQRVKELEAENASLRESETKKAEDLFGHIFTQKQIQLLLSMKQRIHFNNEELALLLFGS